MQQKLQKSFLLSILAIAVLSNILVGQPMKAGWRSSMFLCNDHRAMGCGGNYNGNLDDGTTIDRLTAVYAGTLTSISDIAIGAGFTLFLKSDGTVWACGKNYQGQLGQGTTGAISPITTAVQIPGLSGITSVSAGEDFSLFLKNDSSVWACGSNYYGQLGNGTTVSTGTPFQLPSLNSITAIAAGRFHSLFLKGDGTVLACGYNDYGQLGRGTIGSFSSNFLPAVVTNVNQITKIASGGNHSLFLRNDGTVWICGDNSYGELGDSTTVNRSTPFQLIILDSVTSIGTGDHYCIFLKSDSTVWACGSNVFGQLGDGTTIDRLRPVQVSSLNGIMAISAGYEHSLYLKNDGTLWGTGDASGLGDGTTTDKSTPVQINNICSLLAGVDETYEPPGIVLYPNPARDNIFIEITDPCSILQILNIEGQLIYSAKLQSPKTEIKIDYLTSGMYFVLVKNPKGISVKKFIKE